MRKQFVLMATVAALAVTPALAQTTMPKQDAQPAPQAQPTTPQSAPSAGTTAQAPAGEKFVDMQASGQWLASDLMGLDVIGSNNEKIGDVSDLLVDEDGNILAAVVGVGGFLGIGQKDVAISFDAFTISRDQNGNPEGRLTLTKQEFETAPEFKKAEAPRAAAQRPADPARPAAPRN